MAIDITAVSRLKHADLHNAAKKLGGQSALAKFLGVHVCEIGQWCNLRKTPPKSWPPERLNEIERKLFELTNKTLDQLFPKELQDAEEFLKARKVIETTRTVEVAALIRYAERTAERLSFSNDSQAEKLHDLEVLKERIRKSMKTLSDRENKILELRFGLNGCETHTLAEVGSVLGITGARVRQIESKAIRKLQQPSRSFELVAFAPERIGALPPYQQPREVWPSELIADG